MKKLEVIIEFILFTFMFMWYATFCGLLVTIGFFSEGYIVTGLISLIVNSIILYLVIKHSKNEP
jgi:hypothetical protein